MKTDEKYDSTTETTKHIARVKYLIDDVCDNLKNRGACHDASKLNIIEKAVF